jgi:glycerol kinase
MSAKSLENGTGYQDIYNLLVEMQKSQHRLEERLIALEKQVARTAHANGVVAEDTSELIGAIDQGTTSTRFLIFTKKGNPIASHQVEFTQIYPHPGWHEHDPLELVSSSLACIEGACAALQKKGVSPANIKAVGITNQRETTVVWDAETGEPLHNAIVWTDTRSAALVRGLKARAGADRLNSLSGLPLSTYPSCAKLLWLLENVPKVKAAYDNGRLAFGTVDSWLVYKLNGGPAANVHVSDPTNASRSMFMNLTSLAYDPELLGFFGLDQNKLRLPRIVRSSDAQAFGKLTSGKLAGVPITGCLGDQSAALVGQKGFEPGRAKNTYGTGCFLLYNVGDKPVISKHGLLATVAYDFGGKPQYALEGSIAVAGSAVKFLMNNLGFADKSEDITKLAEGVEDNGGVVFVTAFSGLFAPYWIDDVKGTLRKCAHIFLRYADDSQLASPSTLRRGTSRVLPWKRLVSRPRPSSRQWRRIPATPCVAWPSTAA